MKELHVNTKMALLRPVGTLAMASALGLATVPALAQEEADPGVEITLRGYPMAIHQGTCEPLIAEPAYDLGLSGRVR